MKLLTKRDLARSLHAAGRTTAEIAQTLEVSLLTAATWTGQPYDDFATSVVAQNEYSRKFAGVLCFRDVAAALVSVAKIDALHAEFAEAGDARGVHQAQLMALIGMHRAEGIGKETCARLFREWLVAHLETSE